MKRFMIALIALFVGSGMFAELAHAGRLGGGKSMGMSRSSPAMQREARPPQATSPQAGAAQAPAAQPPRSGMWGMLGGLALGAGLGALFAHSGLGGLGGGLLTMLLLVGGVILLFRLLASRMPQAQPVPNAAPPARFETSMPAGGGGAPAAMPAGFDSEGFLRQAKLNFVRLQAANDSGNMDDIKLFTTPEVYAEIRMQYQERGKAAQQTDVVQLDAVLLDLATENGKQVASVRYSGLVRENADAAPAPFDEIWHLTRPEDGSSGWIVAGIQQFS